MGIFTAGGLLPPKWLSLGYFVLQNCLLIISLRLCVEYTDPEKPYIASTVVLFTEPLKLLFSLIACFVVDAQCNLYTFMDIFQKALLDEGGDMIKLCVPAALYIIQNNLQYTIESAPLFMAVYQMKVITTAVFYSTLLSRRIALIEWISIIFCTVGVAMVQSSQHEFHAHHASNIVGILSVIVACLTSGFAGVYFEKILKASKTSIWMLNIEMSLISCILSVITCLTEDTQEIIDHGFFIGYSSYVVLIIVCQAITGLVVALVVKYADNIHKGFANSLSIMCSGFIESFLFPHSFTINQVFICGCILVVVSSTTFVAVANRYVVMPSSSLIDNKELEKNDVDLVSMGASPSLSSPSSFFLWIEPLWKVNFKHLNCKCCEQLFSSLYSRLFYNISSKSKSASASDDFLESS